jgi:phosphatidylserine/phosphatidylglycerophosphate/cardiolipin synthase-like enzyme
MGKQSSHFHFSTTFLDVNMDSSSESKPTNGGDVQSRLVELLSEARHDLLIQTGRVLPNLSLLAGVKDVISKGGQIDDRKYLVGVLGLVGLTSDVPRN